MMRKISLVIGTCVVLVVLAKLLGLFSLFRAPTPPPIPSTLQTTWTIKFHAANASIQYDGVDFTPSRSQNGCKWATGTPNPTDLTVCQHDIVQWQATTPGGENEGIVTLTDKFFADAAGNPVKVFVGNNGNPTTPPGLVASPDYNSHKWSPIVIDKKDPNNNANDDPKIKVGG